MARLEHRHRKLLGDISRAIHYDGSDEWDDEHARWAVYQDALANGSVDDLLREALGLECVAGVATSVVLLVFEREVSQQEMLKWVRSLPPAHREFVTERARELVVLRALKSGEAVEDPDVTNWTHWLQREAVDHSTARPVIERLARDGHTRKIRNIAAEKLRVGDRRKIWEASDSAEPK